MRCKAPRMRDRIAKETDTQSTLLLNQAQIDRFWQDGFLNIGPISSVDEIDWLGKITERLFKEKTGRESGQLCDLMGADEDEAQPLRLPQLANPSELIPALRDSLFRKNALAVAQQLLGEEAQFWFELAICKPAHHGAATPWHQDAASRQEHGIDYDQVAFWMPLQEATAENGCMQYIPGSHRGPVLDHRSPNNDPRFSGHECVGPFDSARAIACKLNAGEAVIHHNRTLHHAGPNLTSTARLAYILAFRGPNRPDPAFNGYPWNAEKRTAAQRRAEAWNTQASLWHKARHLASRIKGAVVKLGK
jgi:hypothetical protein